MKLSPIDIEKALELSVGTPPAPTMGPVESALRAALKRLGPNGERWIQGTMSKRVGARRMVRPPPMKLSAFVGDEITPQDEFKIEYEIIELGEYAHCVIGAIGSIVTFDEQCFRAIEEAFRTANNINYIPGWNDHPGRTFAEVRNAFETAISYAKSKGI